MLKRPRLLAVLAAVLLVLALVVVWPTPYRDIPLRTGLPSRVLAAREHRFSGRVDFLTPTGWRPATAADGMDRLRALAGTDSLK